MRLVVAQVAFLCAHQNRLNETHVARRRALVFQAGDQFDETRDELNRDFAPDALVHASSQIGSLRVEPQDSLVA